MSREQWSLSISEPYGDGVEKPSPDEQRAGEYLALLLNDRLDDLLAWARGEMGMASGRLLLAVKGGKS